MQRAHADRLGKRSQHDAALSTGSARVHHARVDGQGGPALCFLPQTRYELIQRAGHVAVGIVGHEVAM